MKNEIIEAFLYLVRFPIFDIIRTYNMPIFTTSPSHYESIRNIIMQEGYPNEKTIIE